MAILSQSAALNSLFRQSPMSVTHSRNGNTVAMGMVIWMAASPASTARIIAILAAEDHIESKKHNHQDSERQQSLVYVVLQFILEEITEKFPIGAQETLWEACNDLCHSYTVCPFVVNRLDMAQFQR